MKFDNDADVLPGDLVMSTVPNGVRRVISVSETGVVKFGFMSTPNRDDINKGDPLFVVTRVNPDPVVKEARQQLRTAIFVISPLAVGWIGVGDPLFNSIKFLEPYEMNTEEE